jgi:hypothetical protein
LEINIERENYQLLELIFPFCTFRQLKTGGRGTT